VLEEVAAMIVAGAVVAIPTDTLYGLAVDPFNAAAVARVFAVKGRAGERALPLVAADRQQVTQCLGALPPLGVRLAERFWPGPLTLLLAAPVELAAEITGETGRVGVRVPGHAVTRVLCRLCNRPLTATSANLSGSPPCDRADDVEVSLGDRIDAIVDAGATAGGQASTIVDVTGPEPVLVRSGAIPWDDVRRCLTKA
jgi:L-threonylcarbamoyladenylate synthase